MKLPSYNQFLATVALAIAGFALWRAGNEKAAQAAGVDYRSSRPAERGAQACLIRLI